MQLEQFEQSLGTASIPQPLSLHLQSLWYDARVDWNKAHELIQDVDDKNAAWVHAYLHRKEGDNGNADYWYRRAGRSSPDVSLETEWKNIVKELL